MISFKRYLQEAVHVKNVTADRSVNHKWLPGGGKPMADNKELGKHVSSIGPDHHVYRSKVHGGETEYNVYHHPTKTVHLMAAGVVHKHSDKEGDSAFQEKHLYSHANNTIRAHELYQHILKHHHHTLISADAHSPGGQKVWRRLTKSPGVKNSVWVPHAEKKHPKHGKSWNVDIAKRKSTFLTHVQKSQEPRHDKKGAMIVVSRKKN